MNYYTFKNKNILENIIGRKVLTFDFYGRKNNKILYISFGYTEYHKIKINLNDFIDLTNDYLNKQNINIKVIRKNKKHLISQIYINKKLVKTFPSIEHTNTPHFRNEEEIYFYSLNWLFYNKKLKKTSLKD